MAPSTTEYALVISSVIVFVGFVALVTQLLGGVLASMTVGF
jgi:hypothetical protein